MVLRDEKPDDTIDVIVRFHDVKKLGQLNQAIFSLVNQDYRPLHIHVITQRFSDDETQRTENSLAPLLGGDTSPALSLHNWTEPEPADARSVLINFGISFLSGRYLAFLDYDDVIYPDGYRLLVDALNRSGVVIAFGGICVKDVHPYALYDYAHGKRLAFVGSGLKELFARNFCPIHSFVIDREAIPKQLLYFEPLLARAEDYDFLLRACAQCRSDFSLVQKIIGEYRIRNDGTNTILSGPAASDPLKVTPWSDAEVFLEARRRTTPVSLTVQRSLGIAMPAPSLTIRGLIDGGLEALCGVSAMEEAASAGIHASR